MEEQPMELLTNPNVVYVILVSGLMLAVLALFAPGTGVIEAIAIITLIIAGYGIYFMPINGWALVILIIGVFPFLLALRRSGRWSYLVVSLLALVIGSAYLFPGDNWWQPGVDPLLALVVSCLAGGLMWLIGNKGMQALSRTSTTVLDRLVGATGKAVTPIYEDGSVYVAGETWSAHSAKPIPAKTLVRVIKRDGFFLEVEEQSQ
jgi:membrane-bound ClpP family serine protease